MAKVTNSNPKAFDILDARLKELEGLETKAGWFKSSVYQNGTPVAYVAAIHEFGVPSKNIPPRPFMRPTVLRESTEWALLMGRGAAAILNGKTTVRNIMEAIGLKASGDIAKTITQITTPPLKEATVKARARRLKNHEVTESLRKPLVDTGILLNTISYVVEETK